MAHWHVALALTIASCGMAAEERNGANGAPDGKAAAAQRPTATLASYSSSLVVDGNFSAPLLADWELTTALTDPNGLVQVPPQDTNDLAQLPATTDFTANTTRWVGAPQTLLPQYLDANSTLRLPYASAACAAINLNGNQRRGSSLSQAFVFDADDLDPTDHRLRVRAIAAPVIATSAAHSDRTQSYFLARVANVDTAVDNVAQYFLYGNQPGLPWQAEGTVTYLGWQLVELTPSILDVRSGQMVKVAFTAAGCAATGHAGAVYLDSVGGYGLGSTTVVARGPEHAAPGATVDYVLRVRQGALTAAGPVSLSIATPSNANYYAFYRPPAWACTTPAVGGNGNIDCSIAPLSPNEVVEATLAVVAPEPNATITLGAYAVHTADQLPLLGPAIVTSVAASANGLCNLQVDVVEQPQLATAQTSTCSVHIRNAGPAAASNAIIQAVVGDGLQTQSWHCQAQTGASCGGAAEVAGNDVLSFASDIEALSTISCSVTLTKLAASGNATFGVAARPSVGAQSDVVDTTAWDSESVALVALAAAPASAAPAAASTPTATATAAAPANGNCQTAADCASGFCADGVCCQAACEEACFACNVAGQVGQCVAVSGSGPRASQCSPYLCGDGACLRACEADANCKAGLVCQQHVCRPKRGACATDDDCDDGLLCTPAHTCESLALIDASHPNWMLQGHGCSHGPQGGVGAMAAALGLLARASWRRRKRGRKHTERRAWWTCVLVLLVPAWASAADVAAIPSNHFLVSGGVYDIYSTVSASVPVARNHAKVGLALNYARSPLRLTSTTKPLVSQDIVRQQATLDVTGAYAVIRWLELGLALPLVLQQLESGAWASSALQEHKLQFSVGDLRVTAKSMLYRADLLRAGIGAMVSFPTAEDHRFVGVDGYTFRSHGLLEVGRLNGARFVVNLGAVVRPKRQILNLQVHHALTWSAAGHIPWRLGAAATMAARAGVFGESNLRGGAITGSPGEALAGLHVSWANVHQLDVGGGTGFTNGYGAPRWRVFVTWSKQFVPATKPDSPVRAVEVQAAPIVEVPPAALLPAPPPADRDGDGVPDILDACPDVPGDASSPRPGCPVSPRKVQAALQGATLLHFANDSSVIHERDTASLEQVRQLLEADPSIGLAIDGHTDDSGKPAYNLALSRARATTAKQWLVVHGIAKKRITVHAYGARRLVDKRKSAAARARNRRIQFRQVPRLPSRPAQPVQPADPSPTP